MRWWLGCVISIVCGCAHETAAPADEARVQFPVATRAQFPVESRPNTIDAIDAVDHERAAVRVPRYALDLRLTSLPPPAPLRPSLPPPSQLLRPSLPPPLQTPAQWPRASLPAPPLQTPAQISPQWPAAPRPEPATPLSAEWFHPLAGPLRALPRNESRKFGARRPWHRPPECERGHCGVDLGTTLGDPVFAVSDGVVERIERDATRDLKSGRYIRISHNHGTVVSRYIHLDSIREDLHEGDVVRGSEEIGTLGSTGIYSTGPHLHFSLSLREGGRGAAERYIDPEPLLRAWKLPLPLGERAGTATAAKLPTRNGPDKTPPIADSTQVAAAAPPVDARWEPAHWVWNGRAWTWAPGTWRSPPVAEQPVWIPAHWAWNGAGWIWIQAGWRAPAQAYSYAPRPPSGYWRWTGSGWTFVANPR